MDLNVNYSNVTTKDEAYHVVKEAITPELLAKFQVKAELTYAVDHITAQGKGFKLDMFFKDTECQVKVDLSFLLKPLKSKVLEGIEKQLKRVV